MATYTIHQAKTNLSRLIKAVEAGEEVIIARGDTPVARLVPTAQPRRERVFGAYAGQFKVTDAFFEPMSKEELAEWEGDVFPPADADQPERPAKRKKREKAR